MAIKPIQGFYVHDEDTGTDGVAKLDIDATVGLSDVSGSVDYTTAVGYFGTSGEVYSPGSETKEVYSTEYIPVCPGMRMVLNLKFSASRACWAAFVGYTKSYAVLGRTAVISTTASDATGVYVVPNNCYFVRVSYRTYGEVDATLIYGGISEFLQNNITETIASNKSEVLGSQDRDDEIAYKEALNTPENKMLAQWFEHGNLDANGANQSYRDGSRARTKDVMSFPYPVVISVNSGRFILYYFTNGVFASATSWKISTDAPIYLNANQEFKILVTKDASAPAAQYDELSEIVDLLNFYAEPPVSVNIKSVTDLVFEHGNLDSRTNTNTNYNGAARVRSNMVKLPCSLKVTTTTGSVLIACYDDGGNFLWETSWRQNNPYIIPAGYYFRMIVTLNPSSNVATKIEDILQGLKLEPVDRAVSGASPNIIYQCRNVDDKWFPPYSKYYIQAAAKNQYDRVRVNIRATTDDEFVLIHNDTINATAKNPDGTDIATDVVANDCSLADLNAYDWGVQYGTKYAGMGVPMLEDALKYAAYYNLGFTWHGANARAQTSANLDAQIDLIEKYGLMDNLIVIPSSAPGWDVLDKFIGRNPRVSAYIGGEPEWWTAENIARCKQYLTGQNKVYVQPYPWGAVPDADFIEMAKSNGFALYASIHMSTAALLQESTFNKGYSVIEANETYAIKDTVRDWVNGLVDA